MVSNAMALGLSWTEANELNIAQYKFLMADHYWRNMPEQEPEKTRDIPEAKNAREFAAMIAAERDKAKK